MGRALVACLVLLSLLSGLAEAQVSASDQVRDVSIDLTSPFTDTCSRGFVPVRVMLRNSGLDEQELRLDLSAQWASNMSRSSQSLRVRVAPGTTLERELLVPVDRVRGNNSCRLKVTCKGEQTWMDVDVSAGGADVRARSIAVITDSAMSAGKLEALRLALPLEAEGEICGVFDGSKASTAESVPSMAGMGYGFGYSSIARVRSRPGIVVNNQAATLFGVPMDQMPVHTMGWSTVDTVVMDVSRALSRDVMSPARWATLKRWVRGGGQLVLIGEDLQSRIKLLDGIDALQADRLRVDSPVDPDVRVYRAGLGEISLYDVSTPALDYLESHQGGILRTLDRASLTQDAYPSTLASIYRASLGDAPWQAALPDDQLPIRPVLAFLIVFAVLVAPVNVAVAKARKRPGLIFLTVPLISLVATGLIIGYGVFRQGLGTTGFAHSLAVVDQVQKEVVTVLRREMVMGRGGKALRPLPTTTVLVPDHGKDDSVRSLQQDGNQLRLSGNFLPVRTRTENISVNVDTTRARLEWSFDGSGQLTVTNALGVDLLGLEVKSPDGVVFTANERVKSGATATLTEIPKPSIAAEILPWKSDPIFDAAELPRSGFLAFSEEAGPGADDMSVPMEETYSVHAIMGYLDNSPEKWSR